MTRTSLSSPDSKTIQSFFDAIPKRYDLLNTVLSFSLDRNWRRHLIYEALNSGRAVHSVLDIGTGTGTSLQEFLKTQSFKRAVGCDFSQGMLGVAKEKFPETPLLAADLHELPFENESFDLVTSSFVLRSVKNMDQFLSEVYRILTPHGRFAFLDLTRPHNSFFWTLLYKPYLTLYLPLVGRAVSKHPQAYQFLSQSIQTFIEPHRLKEQMERIGFSSIALKSLSLGAATIYMGFRSGRA